MLESELTSSKSRIEKLQKRLCIGPQGDDQIDQDEECIKQLRFQIDSLTASNAALTKEIEQAVDILDGNLEPIDWRKGGGELLRKLCEHLEYATTSENRKALSTALATIEKLKGFVEHKVTCDCYAYIDPPDSRECTCGLLAEMERIKALIQPDEESKK